jgi:hypothetical protein
VGSKAGKLTKGSFSSSEGCGLSSIPSYFPAAYLMAFPVLVEERERRLVELVAGRFSESMAASSSLFMKAGRAGMAGMVETDP